MNYYKKMLKGLLSFVVAFSLVLPTTVSINAQDENFDGDDEVDEVIEDSEQENVDTEEIEEDSDDENTENLDEESDIQTIDLDEESGDEDDDLTILGKKEVQNINAGWQLTDSGVTTDVNLPHCWEYTHPTMSYIPQMNKKTVTYTKTIDVSGLKDKNVFLKFYAVNKTANIYINENLAYQHVGGFTAFTMDITNFIKPEDGTAIIKVENTNIDTTSIPVNSDFTHFAGIYRDVELITVDKDSAYFSEEYYGADPLRVDYDLTSNSASVNINAEVSSKTEKNIEYTIQYNIIDGEGQTIATDTKDITIKDAINQAFTDSITVSNPHLWNGTNDPYLYTINALLMDKNGNEVDSVSTRRGFRTFSVKNGDLYLNGNKYELHGVGMHQDREGYGNATTDEMKLEDINTIMEMGANAIRTAHYPHSQYIYDLADEKGLIVWSEIPFYMIMANTDFFKNSTKNQLLEMIRQNYNHASIICWGIQNEVNTNAAYAQYGPEFQVDTATLSSFMQDLAYIAKSEDPSRFVVQAHIDLEAQLQESLSWTDSVDYTGFNLYRGFKSEIKSAGQSGYDAIYESYTSKIDSSCTTLNQDSIVISEYGAGGNIDQHATVDSDFYWSGNDSKEPEHPEEYMNFVHEAAYKAISDSDKVWCAFVWNMFDFSCYRTQGGKARLNNKGLLTYDHQTRKDAFYFYKANWNKTDKFVYITSRRMTERTRKDSTIKVYSNCDKVKLYMNGKDLGYGTKQQDGVFVWNNVKYSTTKANTIKAVGEANGTTYEDEISDIQCKNTNVSYTTHVQNIGCQKSVVDGETAGTSGQSLRLEGIKISLDNDEYDGDIEYRTHVQGIGWQDYVSNGEIAGTSGQSRRLEAIQIRLTGEMAKQYDVYYRVHAQNIGWMDWAKNDEKAGTAGYSYRLEAIQIVLVKKGNSAPGKTTTPYIQHYVKYNTHVQNIGWQTSVYDGKMAGTTGQSLRLEGINISLSNPEYSGSIQYRTHIQNIGWEKKFVSNGQTSGTVGQSKRLEAIEIKLTGEMAKHYDVYYRVHSQNIGWMDWAKNGQSAGTAGYSYRLEGIEIVLVPKGGKAPGSTKTPFKQK